MTDLNAERDDRKADLLQEALAEFRANGRIDLAAWQARLPEFAAELPGLLETLRKLDAACTPTPAPQPGDSDPAEIPTLPPVPHPVRLEFLAPPQGPGELGRLGSFRVLAVLGAGGMGLVLHAEDSVLRRPVALKVMRPEVAARQGARERFLREARAAAAISHDNVVPIHQVGEEGGVPFLVMPLLQGEPLTRRLQREGRLPLADLLLIGRQAAEGLAAAHAKGLTHRDVKPGNLWLETSGVVSGGVVSGEKQQTANHSPLTTHHSPVRVKVLDFGLARPEQDGTVLTEPGALLGTPAYMAPEQVRGEGVGPRSDLFGLGVVLYEMATGQRPFQGKDPLSLLRALELEDPTPVDQLRPDLPPLLAALIGRLLAKKAEERPGSAREVAETLRVIEAGSPPSDGVVPASSKGHLDGPVTPPTQSPAQRRPGWRRLALGETISPRRALRRLAVGGSLAVALCVLVGAALWWRWSVHSRRASPPREGTAPLTATLDVRVWKKADTSRGLTLADPGALPLRPGDWMRIEATASRPAYLYVVYLDAKGEASPMFPWRKYDWSNRPKEEARTVLHLPEDPRKDGAPLESGPPGIEAVLLLAREEALTAAKNDRLRRALRGPAKQGKFDPLLGAVWLGEEKERFGVAADRDRARPAQEKAGAVADPVERLRRLLRGEVSRLAAVRRGVCYPFAGK
jgi:serine/threonine protein kinase